MMLWRLRGHYGLANNTVSAWLSARTTPPAGTVNDALQLVGTMYRTTDAGRTRHTLSLP
jgi:hypothetical protein